jgi:hypothetical protein
MVSSDEDKTLDDLDISIVQVDVPDEIQECDGDKVVGLTFCGSLTSEQAYWWGQSLTSGTQDDDS